MVLFGRLGEIAGEYLKKGRQVYIEGSLRTNKYTDKEGIERYTTDIVANEMQMLGGGGEGGFSGGRSGGQSRDRGPARGSQADSRDESQGERGLESRMPDDIEDDDIPF